MIKQKVLHRAAGSIPARGLYRVYKKKVIELQRAIIRELLGVRTIGFHIRKDQAFSY